MNKEEHIKNLEESIEKLEAKHQKCIKCGNEYLANSHEYPCPYCTPSDDEVELQKAFKYLSEICESNKDVIKGFAGGRESYWGSMQYWIEHGRKAIKSKSEKTKTQLDVRIPLNEPFPDSIRLHRGTFTTVVEIGEIDE